MKTLRLVFKGLFYGLLLALSSPLLWWLGRSDKYDDELAFDDGLDDEGDSGDVGEDVDDTDPPGG